MILFVFTKYAKKVFDKLPKIEKERILNKLTELKKHQDVFSVLRKLVNFDPATHRLRIGDYRLILELKKYDAKIIEFWVLDVGHRRDVYR